MTSILLRLFQLLLGVFFSTRSVALIEDIPGKMKESEGYKSSAKLVSNCVTKRLKYRLLILISIRLCINRLRKCFSDTFTKGEYRTLNKRVLLDLRGILERWREFQ